MDELEISGKRYISTRRAAREHGYHSDYMGQLIRGKKVAGQKVGRAWYIEEDSLNVYLGKAPAPAPTPKAPADAEVSAPAPVERLVVEEPVSVQPEVQAAPAPTPVVVQPTVEAIHEVHSESRADERPVAVHVAPQIYTEAQPAVQYPVAAQEIHHAPLYREEERRIPIHTPATAREQEVGGLRYAADDSPSLPVVTRIQPVHAQTPMPSNYVSAQRPSKGTFPYISLSIVGVIALLASAFASNFISATVVTEQGKAATVQYAIHW